MTVTRDADFPVEIATLFQTFNRCAEGHDLAHVLDAATNLVLLAISTIYEDDREQAVAYAAHLGQRLPGLVAHQYDRAPHPADVVVPLQGH